MLKLRLRINHNTTIKLHVQPHTTPRYLLLLAKQQHPAAEGATALSLDKNTALAPQDAPLSDLGIASGDLPTSHYFPDDRGFCAPVVYSAKCEPYIAFMPQDSAIVCFVSALTLMGMRRGRDLRAGALLT